MKNPFTRNKNQATPEMKASIAYGAVLSDSHRPLTETESMDQLGINIHTIEDLNIISSINGMIAVATDGNSPSILIFDLCALRNILTKLLRCSRLEKIDAFVLLKKSKVLLRNIKMNLTEELINMGALDFIDSIEILVWTAINDAVGGWKGKLLKVSPKQFEIAMHESKTKEPMI